MEKTLASSDSNCCYLGKKVIVTLGFKKRHFFRRNLSKIEKIVIITFTPIFKIEKSTISISG
jgi:hypothetical protein